MITRAWKIYDVTGYESARYDWSTEDEVRIVELISESDYTIIRITKNTADECEEELNGQISDGLFENERVMRVEEIQLATLRQSRYDGKACTRISLKLNNTTDADIIEWLSKQSSKQGAIKSAIRLMIEER